MKTDKHINTNSDTVEHDSGRQRSFADRLMRPINAVVENFLPSSMTFAIFLTGIVGIGALLLTDSSPRDVVVSWGDGLAGLLSFMTQMALVLLLGSTLAGTKPVNALLRKLASLPQKPRSAYLMVFLVGAVGSLITWGLGLMVGGLLARFVAVKFDERQVPISFPMLVATAYSGFVVWHMGYSGSAPLIAATPDSFVSNTIGTTIPLSETIFSWWNIVAVIATVALVAVTLLIIAPRSVPKNHHVSRDVISEATEPPSVTEAETPADRVDSSRILTLIFGLLLVAYLILYFIDGGTMTLDIVNWTFLALILLLVSNVQELVSLVTKAAANVGDILLQFPLYAGIMGIMSATGLIAILSEWLVSISTENTLGLWSFFSAGLVNFFVPSGGGQVAVQGPIILDAAQALGVDPAIAVMAIAYGDQWTNMIQPFWALPLLALAGLKVREILGYTTAVLIASGVTMGGAMLTIGILMA